MLSVSFIAMLSVIMLNVIMVRVDALLQGSCHECLSGILINDALPDVSVTEPFYSSSLTQRRNKLERFPLQVFLGKSNVGV
jgi:hypothetical protein